MSLFPLGKFSKAPLPVTDSKGKLMQGWYMQSHHKFTFRRRHMNFIQIKYKMLHSNNFWKYIFTYFTYFISFALYMIDSQKKKDNRCIRKIKNEKTHNLVGMPFSSGPRA